MRHKTVVVATLISTIVAPVLLAADAPSLSAVGCAPSLTSVTCASPAAPVKITARLAAPNTTAKVYFKAAGQQDEYYVDMRRAADGTMTTFVPAPARSTPSFTYRVVAMDVNGVQIATPLSTATVTPTCPAQNLTSDQVRASNNMIIGLTTPTQSAVPTGFLCRGIVSFIDTDGNLRQNEECRRVVAMGIDGTPSAYASSATTTASSSGAASSSAGTTASSASTTGSSAAGATNASTANTIATSGSTASTSSGAMTTGGGIAMSHGTIIALTAAGLLGAGAVIANNHRHNHDQVSQSRP